MIRVVCWLWRDDGYRFNHLFRYGAEHVNRWASAVGRHLSMDHEIVCITDDPAGIDPAIRIVPLWDDLRDMGGCYTRLKAFSPSMRDIIGERFVWMDLDCVITGSLDPLFGRDEDFVIWANGVGPTPYCGSMVMMTAGARQAVWDDFRPAESPLECRRYVGTDQAWIAHRLPGEAVWSPSDGVLSFTGDIAPRWRRQRHFGRAHFDLPDHARVVFFHGPNDPSQPEIQAACPWVAEHWQ